MKIGQLNKRITIVTPGTLTSDGFGGFTSGANTEADVWCSAERLNQRESLSYGLEVGAASYKFTFIWLTVTLTQQKKLKYQGNTYRIISVIDLMDDNKTVEVIANIQTN